jgi:hypothetical protein
MEKIKRQLLKEMFDLDWEDLVNLDRLVLEYNNELKVNNFPKYAWYEYFYMSDAEYTTFKREMKKKYKRKIFGNDLQMLYLYCGPTSNEETKNKAIKQLTESNITGYRKAILETLSKSRKFIP